MRIVVFGAGAVGSTLGGLLALRNNEVLLVCRKEHARAIESQQGLRMRSATGDYFAQLGAVERMKPSHYGEGSVVFFTPKSNDTTRGCEELAAVVPDDAPVVSFQNGVGNEGLLAAKFSRVYGGVCRMTCSFLHPGQVTFRRLGRIIVGKYPKGSDALARKLASLFEQAGFQSAVSRTIMDDKWLKLVVNLQSTFNAIIDERDHDGPEFVKLKVGVLEEAKRVLRAHKIRARSCDGKDLSIDEMIRDLRKPKAQRSSSSLKVHNSTWQNLYLKRRHIENSFFHKPIIDLAAKQGIPVPYNEVALELATKCHREQTGPGLYRAGEVLAIIASREGEC